MSDTLLIYVPKITNRVKYAFNLVFKDILGVGCRLTANADEFKSETGCKINYSQQPFADELFFMCRNLLFETGITDQNITVSDYNSNKVFFSTGKTSSLPFDPFAASFYLASRYEEYLPQIRDKYDRFNASESLAFQHNFITKPVVNIWGRWVKGCIQVKYPHYPFPEKKFEYIPTIDIDNAYAYREKGFMRNIGGYLKSLSTLDFEQIAERTKVLLGMEKDPYDTYELQFNLQNKYKLKPIYFFLLGDYGINDKNLPVESRKFQTLIKMVADYAEVGIHPSFGSNKNTERVKEEINRLSKIVNREITKSRQHFLKLTLPETYRNLIDLDITDDYTMGFAQHIGFRAGICTPFYFYDLDSEIETKLKIHPFAVMDATLKYYMKVEPADAMKHIQQLIEEVKAVDGIFMSLWHNDVLNDQREWKGWKEIYEQMIQSATGISANPPGR